MNYDEFKKIFDENFNKITPKQLVKSFEKMGYEFEDLEHSDSFINKPIVSLEHTSAKYDSKLSADADNYDYILAA